NVTIRFLGWQNELIERMLDADVLALCSEDEGIPNVVQEAMICGLPVIVSTAGGLPEIIRHGETGWIVDSDDPVHWAMGIIKLQEDTALRSALSGEAAVFATREFSRSNWCRRYLAHIQRIAR